MMIIIIIITVIINNNNNFLIHNIYINIKIEKSQFCSDLNPPFAG